MRTLLYLTTLALAQGLRSAPLELRDGDRIALTGTAVIERDQKYGSLETALSLAAGDKRLIFRNLGWSGDTLAGDARSYFGPPSEGLDRLKKQLELVKPTQVLACYGADLAFASDLDRKLGEFKLAYGSWIDMVRAVAPNARLTLVSPAPLENLPPPFPNQDENNLRLIRVRDTLKEIAAQKDCGFVDIFGRMSARPAGAPLTTNGVEYSPKGHEAIADAWLAELGLSRPRVADAALRELVVRKDEQFFHRHRPANETYLFLFRKHEQGRNAAEIPKFDPLIEELDAKIHQTKLGLLTPSK
jgi:lysophospholipase L1-like esterase